MTPLILIVALLTWIFAYIWSKRKIYKCAKDLPIDVPQWPLLGHAHLCIGSNEVRMKSIQLVARKALETEGVTSLWLGNRLFLVISDPEIAEHVMRNCPEKDDILRFLTFVIGNGSIFAPSVIWRPRRKVLAPTFSPKNLNSFVYVFARQSQVLAEQLQTVSGGKSFPMWNFVSNYTLDSVFETTMGMKINAQTSSEQPFLRAMEQFTALTSARTLQPWFHSDFVYRLLPDYRALDKARATMWKIVNEVIQTKRQEILERGNKKDMVELDANCNIKDSKSFLDLLIEGSGGERGYSDTELREEVLVLVIAGTDTSAVGAGFTFLMLAKHQEWQDIVYQELLEVFGKSQRLVTPEDLPLLKKLDAFIRETLRLYPPVPITARKVTKEFTLPSGVRVPAGVSAMICNWGIHRNPAYWGADVDTFRPERFLEAPLKHPAQFIAFSHGARNCLGYQYAMMSMKTALATVLRRYRVLPGDGPEIRVKYDIMMKDTNNFNVRLENRNY